MSSPDHFIEVYWSSFKEFIKLLKNKVTPAQSDELKLDDWIITLNIMKTNHEYVNIEKKIEQYIAITGWIMMKYHDNYYFNLFLTNLKRWKKVPSLCVENMIHKNSNIPYFNHINDKSFCLYIELLTSLIKKVNYLTNPIYIKLYQQLQIPDYNNMNEINTTIEYNINHIYEVLPELIDNKKENSLNVISKYINMKQHLKNYYGIEIISRGMSARKFLPLLKNYN